MQHLFVLAGLPARYAHFMDGSVRRAIAGDTGELVSPSLPKGLHPPNYSTAYRDELLKAAHRWAQKRGPDEKFSITLLYPDASGTGTASLLDDFFPFSFTSVYRALGHSFSDPDMRREFNELVEHLKPHCVRIRAQAKIMHDHLAERLRRTPFLLPPENFNHLTLTNALEYLHRNAAADGDLQKTISVLGKQIDSDVRREPKNLEKYYVNNDGLQFESPKKGAFHGGPSPSGHPERCYLRARVRLGASYDSTFHYDCSPVKGSQFRPTYDSCHSPFAIPAGRKHLNISPNEFVR